MANKSSNKEAKKSTDRLAMLEVAFESMPIGIAIARMDGRAVLLNKKFREIHQLGDSNDQGQTFAELIKKGAFSESKEDPELYFKELTRVLSASRSHTAEIVIGDKVIAVRDAPLNDDFILTTQEDITAQVKAERRVAHLAHHDSLTNLPNRAAFEDSFAAALAEARADKGSFALLSVDLDRFKDINHVFGHSIGDALLLKIADRFRKIAADAFPARLGSDEFIFLSVVDGDQRTGAAAMAERLLDEASGEMMVGGQRLLVSLSIGIAIYPNDGLDATTLLNNADAARHRAKKEGRGTVRFYEQAMDERTHKHRQLAQDLHVALAHDELTLCYQSQARMNGEITGFEALIRWAHPTFGEIPPTEFVPLAEDNGLIIEIGEWVLRRACSEAASWSNPLAISVNVSPIQFRHGDLTAMIHEILLESGLTPDRLEIEITEGVLIDNHARALSILRRIKNLGVRIAMDDFGTGYSSLCYLQSFPFDKLKIDQSFTERLDRDEQARKLVSAVIELGRTLKLPTVAEGVETIDQFNFLAEAGCSGVQGFYIGRPNSIGSYADLTERLAEILPAPKMRTLLAG